LPEKPGSSKSDRITSKRSRTSASRKLGSSWTTCDCADGCALVSASINNSASKRESSRMSTRSGMGGSVQGMALGLVIATGGAQGPRRRLVEHRPEHAQLGDGRNKPLEGHWLHHVGVH